MKLSALSDRLRLTGTEAVHSARFGAIPGARWNKSQLCWEYPRSPFAAQSIVTTAKRKGIQMHVDTEIGDLLKQFTAIMDAKKWKGDGEWITRFPPGYWHTRTRPWAHQWRASQFIKDMTAAYLALDMGTGKTLVAINEVLRTKAQSTLIICPKSVLDVWANEFAIHVPEDAMPDVRILTEPTSKDKAVEAQWHATMAQAREKALVLLVNYESAWRGDLGAWLLKRRGCTTQPPAGCASPARPSPTTNSTCSGSSASSTRPCSGGTTRSSRPSIVGWGATAGTRSWSGCTRMSSASAWTRSLSEWTRVC